MGQQSRRGSGMVALTAAAVIGLSLVGTGTANAGGGHGGSGLPPGTTTVIATKLDNPRQLSFTPTGDLLVAEAGKGAIDPATATCFPSPEGGDQSCYGNTGAVTRISRGQQTRIITGLPSIGSEVDGSTAVGPSDVAGDGRTVSVLIGFGADPTLRPTLPAPGNTMMGTLQQASGKYTKFRTVADFAAYEQANDPAEDPEGLNSNPVGMLANCGTYIVADAGANDVLRVGFRGDISVLAVLPRVQLGADTTDPVPTSVAAKGYDGSYYVSQLTGAPFPKGAANIYKIDRKGTLSVYASGLTNVTDLAFNGRDLYAVQFSTDGLATSGPFGSVVKVKPGGQAPGDHTFIAGASGDQPLFAPYGIAIKNNAAYVTRNAIAANTGEVIRIQL